MRYSEMKAVETARTTRMARAGVHGASLHRPQTWMVLLLVGLIGALLMGCSSSAQYRDQSVAMKTHGPVDLAEYQGLWYEIARFPNSFEEGCVGVTAEYSVNSDGTVKVVNTCRKGTLDGPVETAEGVATSTNADNDKLEVTFVPWLPFAKGDYWILDLAPDYSVVVVGNPAGTTGWVLARMPDLPQEALEAAYKVLRQNGYDTARIVPVLQN